MKKILFILSILISGFAYGQTTGFFRYDTVTFQKVGGNSEFKLQNATRNVTGGVLTNMGGGRTAFVMPGGGSGNFVDTMYRVNDSTVGFTINGTPYTFEVKGGVGAGGGGSGITSLNTLTGATQTFATPGTSGTAPNWVSSGTAHTLHIPLASAAGVTVGGISKTDYDAIINTAGDLSPLFTTAETSHNIAFTLSNTTARTVFGRATGTGVPSFISLDTNYISGFSTMVRPLLSLTTTGTSGAATYSNVTGVFNIPQYQGTGNYITALTGDVTATGPGSVAATLATVNSNVGSFTYGSFTVNAKGLITAASSGAAPVLVSDSAAMLAGYPRSSRSILTGYGLTGGGDLTTNRTHVFDSATVFPQIRATMPGITGTATKVAYYHGTTGALTSATNFFYKPTPANRNFANPVLNEGTITVDAQNLTEVGIMTKLFDPAVVSNEVYNFYDSAAYAITTGGAVSGYQGVSSALFVGVKNSNENLVLQLMASPRRSNYGDSAMGVYFNGRGINIAGYGPTNPYIRFGGAIAANEYARFDRGGFFGLNTPTPTHQLTVNGQVRINSIGNVGTPDSTLYIENGVLVAGLTTAGGLGTVTSVDLAYGITGSSDPITTTGTVIADTTILVNKAGAQVISGVKNFTATPTLNGAAIPSISSTSTLTNKTLTNPQINGALLETSSTAGYVWTATNTAGAGAWAAATGSGGLGSFYYDGTLRAINDSTLGGDTTRFWGKLATKYYTDSLFIGHTHTWNSLTDPTGTQTLSFGDAELNAWTNGSNTETFHTITSNSLTTGKVLSMTSSSVTTGSLLNLASTSTAANGFSLLNIASSGTNANASRSAYGALISVANTGTTSQNIAILANAQDATTSNVGVQATASGASGQNTAGGFTASGGATTNIGISVVASGASNNYAIIVPPTSGRIGFGTATPAVQFHNVGAVRFATLGTAVFDTTTYKPLGIDATGNLIPITSWPVGAGGGSSGLFPTTGTGTATGDVTGNLDTHGLYFTNVTIFDVNAANDIDLQSNDFIVLNATAGVKLPTLTATTILALDSDKNIKSVALSGLTYDGTTLTATGGSGTVTDFSAGNLSPLFTTTEATTTTTPALSFALTNAAANTWFGNNTGSSAAPSYNAFGTGVNTWITTPTSANLAAALTNETGTTFAVFSADPTLTGTVTVTGATGTALIVGGGITPGSGANGFITQLGGGITEFSSGTHAILAGTAILAPVVTGGSATVTSAASLYISGATNASGANNAALWVAAGDARFGQAGTAGGSIKVEGSTSGIATIVTAAAAGTPTITLPAATGTLATLAGTETFTNKRITVRYGSTTSSATPTINTDNVDTYELTAQAANITSFTTNLSGTPTTDQVLHIIITGTAARTIAWGASFEASTVPLPTTTVSTNRLDVYFIWTGSIWRTSGTF